MPPPPRLIDLHVPWLLQYASESTQFDPALYPEISGRLGQLDGYLDTTAAAFVSLYRTEADWAHQDDPRGSLFDLMARADAEFAGRILTDAKDFSRWRASRRGLTWAVLCVGGLDAVVRSASDLDLLHLLFERGVRGFQITARRDGPLGNEHGLTPLGRDLFRVLGEIAIESKGPRPVVDLAGMAPAAVAQVLDWFESDPARAGLVLLLRSHGAGQGDLFLHDLMTRFRALGGTIGLSVGPPYMASPEELREAVESIAAIPFEGRAGTKGIAIGTAFLRLDQTLPGLSEAAQVGEWLNAHFPDSASDLIHGNALSLITRLVGPHPGTEPKQA